MRFALELLRDEGFTAGRAAGAGPRGAAVLDRLPARRPRPDLRDRRRRPVPGRHLGGARSPRCTPTRSSPPRTCRCATRASRPAFGARPAPPGGTRAGSSASTSSTRSRCSRSVEPDASADEHERILAIQERILGELEIPYRVVNIAGRRPRRLGREEVRLRGLAPGPGPLPRADLMLEHDRLPGAAPRLPLPARRGGAARARAHAERHRGGGRAHPDRTGRKRPN